MFIIGIHTKAIIYKMSSLVLIDANSNVPSSAGTRELVVTGIDSTYDKYIVRYKAGYTTSNNGIVGFVTKSGLAHTSAEYYYSGFNNYNGTYRYRSSAGGSAISIFNNVERNYTLSRGIIIVEFHLTNFPDAEYDYITMYGTAESNDGYCYNMPYHTTVVKNATASDGFMIQRNASATAGGELYLYGVQ